MNGKKIAVTPSAYSYPLLIKQLLHAPLAQTARQEIVYRDVRRLTYLELRDRIGRLASALEMIGVRPGDSVGVLDWDSNRFLEAFFAIPMMGVVLQTVNVRLSPEQVAYTIDHAGSSTLLINDEFVDLVQSILPQLSKVKRLIVLTDRKAPVTGKLEFAGEYEQLLAAASPDFEFNDFDENVQATTFYTTGTTGLPKGVYYSHRQLVLHAMAELAVFGLAAKQGSFHRDDVYMPITPMFHVHAWGFPWAATADVDLTGLKMVIGGSALPKALARQAMDRGVDVFAGYGMSETGPLLTVAHLQASDLSGDADQEVEIRTRAGRAVPLVDLRIVDANMDEAPHDGATSGEIVVRAPWLTNGYFNSPDSSEQLWAGGYLHTNDIGVITPDGYLRVTDRIKDVIKTGGEWVSSLQLEDIILHRAGVGECAVIGVKDDRWGERPLALIVRDPKTAPPVIEEDIKAHVLSYSEKGVISKFVDALAKTSVGKFDKKALRAQYGGGA
jgi:fatty-acyl-CoA synthase